MFYFLCEMRAKKECGIDRVEDLQRMIRFWHYCCVRRFTDWELLKRTRWEPVIKMKLSCVKCSYVAHTSWGHNCQGRMKEKNFWLILNCVDWEEKVALWHWESSVGRASMTEFGPLGSTGIAAKLSWSSPQVLKGRAGAGKAIEDHEHPWPFHKMPTLS